MIQAYHIILKYNVLLYIDRLISLKYFISLHSWYIFHLITQVIKYLLLLKVLPILPI